MIDDYDTFTEEHADEEILVMEEYRGALVGFAERCGQGFVAVYDYDRLLELLAEGASDDEDPELSAQEWMDYNIAGAWVGEKTPLLLHRLVGEKDPAP